MKLETDVDFLGVDLKQSAKGNSYVVFSFCVGNELFNVMADNKRSFDYSDFKKYECVHIVVDYSLQWKRFTLESISKVKEFA